MNEHDDDVESEVDDIEGIEHEEFPILDDGDADDVDLDELDVDPDESEL